MQLKLPKPRAGWSHYAGEVVVVVLGVLIALGAQQVADDIQWRKSVRVTEEALASEIAASVVHSAERQMVYPCLRARMNELVAKINANDSRWIGDPMPLGNEATGAPILPAAYRTPDRDWDDSVWEAAKSSGVFTHMPSQRVAAYSNLYAIMETTGQSMCWKYRPTPNCCISAMTPQ